MSHPNHTATCNLHHDDADKARRAWQEKWPGHCETCEGEGGKGHPGSYDCPPDWDICPNCQEGDNLRCPRCGEPGETWDEAACDSVACKECGWDPANPDICPPPWECWTECEEADA